MILCLARHGETDWNREGRYQGQRESQLTPIGEAQARALAQALGAQRFARVISSPLRRCTETALPAACACGVALETEPRLIEIAHGTWEGRLRSEIAENDPRTMREWREAPQRVHFAGGESLAGVRARLRAWLASLEGESGSAAAVTHDVLVRLAILEAQDRPLADLWRPRVVNGGYARFAFENGTLSLLDECVDEHLNGLLVDTAQQAL
jgi:broad specificity phosphatase PhoE